MPPIEIGTAAWIAKYAPILFMVVNKDKLSVDWHQLAHTLIVSGIVALVTMYGTVRVMDIKLEYQDRQLNRLTAMAEEAIKVQREIVPMRNLQIKTLQEDVKDHEVRITSLEKRK